MIISLIHSFDPSIYYAIFVQSIRRAEIIIFDHDEIKFFKKYYYIYNVELKKKGDKVKKKRREEKTQKTRKEYENRGSNSCSPMLE